MNAASWFSDRPAVLATKHRKEQVIAPILQQAFGMEILVPPDLDTDLFGTFTRDVERPGDQHQTARLKAERAMELTGLEVAIASEGSFGPHPLFPYIPCNREIVLLIDSVHQLELVGEELSTQTNYRHQVVTSVEEAEIFAEAVGFPEHGLVVLPDPASGETGPIVKGILTSDQWIEAVVEGLKRSPKGTIQVETDMRAMYNPTRMKVIEQATLNLVQKMTHGCPQCGYPGFDIVRQQRGLPCSLCHLPTALTLSVIYGCQRCGYEEEVRYPNGVETADPAQCASCNP